MLSEAEKKFKECVIAACEMENTKANDEVQECEPHVFSEEFERKMEDVFRMYKRRRLMDKVKRYAAVAAVLVVVAAGGVFLTSNRTTEATTPSVNVLEWLKDYFSFEKGDSGKKEDDVIFAEEQIGFIPEGFELSGEVIASETAVRYEYTNAGKEFIVIRVTQDKASAQKDSEGVVKAVDLNEAGYEYTYIYKENNQCHVFIWEDKNGLYYNLTGDADKEIMFKIMDSIKYER